MPAGHGLAHAERRRRSAGRRPRCRGTSPGCRAARASGRRRAGRAAPRAAPRPGAPGRGTRAPGRCGRPGRGRALERSGSGVGRDVGLQPGEERVPVGGFETPRSSAPRPPSEPTAPQRALQLAQVAAERGEQRMADPQVRVVGRCAARPRPGRRASSHSASEGCGSHRWTSRCSPSAASSSTSVTAIRVCPNSESRGGRSGRSGAPAQRLDHVARAAAPGVGSPTSRDQPAPELGLPGEVGREVAPPAPSVSSCLLPVGEQGRAAARRTTRTAGPAAGPRRSAARAAARRSSPSLPWPRWVLSVRAPGLAGAGVDDRQQRPDQRVRRPRVVLTRAGELATRLARRAEPRRRRRRRPRGPRRDPAGGTAAGSASARRPCAGTRTSSCSNGSGSGSRSSSASPSASWSARGARWTIKLTARASPRLGLQVPVNLTQRVRQPRGSPDRGADALRGGARAAAPSLSRTP